MTDAYFYTYLFLLIAEMIMSIVMLGNLDRSIGRDFEVRTFKNLIRVFMLFIITEFFWVGTNSDVLPLSENITIFVSLLNVGSISTVTYIWFKYVQAKVHPEFANNKLANIIWALPIAVVYLLRIFSIRTHWLFYCVGSHTYQGRFYPLLGFLLIVYLAYATWIAVMKGRSAKLSSEREEYYALIRYIIPPIIALFIDEQVYYTPVVGLGVLVGIFMVYDHTMKSKIFNDALTGLNNRRKAEDFIETSIPNASTEHPLVICMMDVDNFKKINDTYGHNEGDKALIIISECLKETASSKSTFAGRYGGDEFLLIGRKEYFGAPKKFRQDLDALLDSMCKSNGMPYRISLSMGCAYVTDPNESREEVIRRADDQLYMDKRRRQKLSSEQKIG